MGIDLVGVNFGFTFFLWLSEDFSIENILKGNLKFKFRYDTEKINTKFHISYQS